MADLLSSLLNAAILIFSVSSMLSVGLSFTFQEIVAPLANVRGVLFALAANFIVVPLLTYGVAMALSLEPAATIGLLLVATAAGAPFLIKLTHIAKGDTAFASSLLVLLLLTTIVYMPIVVPLIVPTATVDAFSIAKPLMLTMLLPLVLGLIIDAFFEPWTDRLLPVLNTISTSALVVLVLATVAANFASLLSVFGTGAILAAVLVIAGAFVVGYVSGGSNRAQSAILGLAAAQRNIAAATVVATQSFEDPMILVMVVVTSIVSMGVLFPTARAIGTLGEPADAVPRLPRKFPVV